MSFLSLIVFDKHMFLRAVCYKQGLFTRSITMGYYYDRQHSLFFFLEENLSTICPQNLKKQSQTLDGVVVGGFGFPQISIQIKMFCTNGVLECLEEFVLQIMFGASYKILTGWMPSLVRNLMMIHSVLNEHTSSLLSVLQDVHIVSPEVRQVLKMSRCQRHPHHYLLKIILQCVHFLSAGSTLVFTIYLLII